MDLTEKIQYPQNIQRVSVHRLTSIEAKKSNKVEAILKIKINLFLVRLFLGNKAFLQRVL
jgi:hypothetical protein